MSVGWTPDQYQEWKDRNASEKGGARSINQSSGTSVGRPVQLEAEIQAECVRILESDGWRHLRTDPVSDRKRGKGFGELGMADSLFVRYRPSPKYTWKGQDKPNDDPCMPVTPCQAEVLWIEWKRGLEHATPHQVAWHQKERARGALTWIANEDFPATVDGFREHYRTSELCRNTLI
jgi:hypothetical protein